MTTNRRRWWQAVVLSVLLALAGVPLIACGYLPTGPNGSEAPLRRNLPTPECTSAPESAVSLGDHSEQLSAGATILFNNAVNERDRARVIEGLEAVRAYLTTSGVALPRAVCVDVRVTEFGLSGSASATGSHILLFTTAEGWPMPQSWHLQMVTAHEYVHAWEYEASGGTLSVGPTWLIEGAAQLVAYRTLVRAGLLTQAEASALMTRPSGSLVPPLESLEAPDSFDVVNSPYALACAAVDVLIADGGMGALEAYWRGDGAGLTWQDAFSQAFGVSPAGFYRRFDSNPPLGFGVRPH